MIEIMKPLPEVGVVGSFTDPPCRRLAHSIGRLAEVFRELLDSQPKALYELKRGTVRPLDRQDAEALRQEFGLGED